MLSLHFFSKDALAVDFLVSHKDVFRRSGLSFATAPTAEGLARVLDECVHQEAVRLEQCLRDGEEDEYVTANLPLPADLPLMMFGAASSRVDIPLVLEPNVAQLNGMIRNVRFKRNYPLLFERPHCIVEMRLWFDHWKVYEVTPALMESFNRIVVGENRFIPRWRKKNTTLGRMNRPQRNPHYLKIYETETEFCILVKMKLQDYQRRFKKILRYK